MSFPRPLVVGLAGGVASGKSTAARQLAGADGVVVDADEVTREVQTDPRVIQEMERILGGPLRLADGTLDRAAAARVAFADPERRRALEDFIHPEIRRRIEVRVGEAQARATATGAPPIVVLDVPLLFEGGLAEKCDRIVFVESQESERIARARSTRGWGPDEVWRRESHQLDLQGKRMRSQHVLKNTGTPEELANAVAELRQELLQAR